MRTERITKEKTQSHNGLHGDACPQILYLLDELKLFEIVFKMN